MPELLHAWAIAPAAVGACCIAADRRRVRAPELLASALMLLAMLDTVTTALVPPVYWTAVLLAGALALAGWRSPRRGRTPAVASASGMTAHTASGMVLMGALPLVMGTSAARAAPGHAHGAASGWPLLAVAVALAVAAYLIASVHLARRMRSRRDRAQVGAMAASAGLMAAALLS